MSDVATPKPEAAFVPRPLADIRIVFSQLGRLDDEATAVAVVKAFAKSIARSEYLTNVLYRRTCDLPLLGTVPDPLIEMDRLVVGQMREFRLRFPTGGEAADQREWGAVSISGAFMSAIVDWLVHLRQTDPRAYGKVPRMAFSAMWQAQQRWHAALAKRKTEAAAADLASCPVLHRYDDGWSWVWVRTDAERDAEGDAMGHCVGQGAYDDLDRRGGAIISLRDPHHRPHVTIEISGTRRMQARGRANAPPADRYLSRIVEATLSVGAAISRYGEPRWIPREEASAIVSDAICRKVRAPGPPIVTTHFRPAMMPPVAWNIEGETP
ncbi:PcfJ domain-containing protein [Aureimonas sp. SK2]|uniref:PcfJ domain-containing protein n=1 Tax=Aureimonas sp. SK2 TaxID=3015992 RepID=UPI0024453123|nr:PcfJ domain-containing protein [Aureimonas sp. SK2]